MQIPTSLSLQNILSLYIRNDQVFELNLNQVDKCCFLFHCLIIAQNKQQLHCQFSIYFVIPNSSVLDYMSKVFLPYSLTQFLKILNPYLQNTVVNPLSFSLG